MSLRPLGIKKDDKSQNRLLGDNFRNIENRFRTNVVRQANGNAIVTGKLPYDGGYGNLYYNTDGVPTIIIGILPDGTTGLVIAKEGEDVLDAFA